MWIEIKIGFNFDFRSPNDSELRSNCLEILVEFSKKGFKWEFLEFKEELE
jgi:hypothetical protein